MPLLMTKGKNGAGQWLCGLVVMWGKCPELLERGQEWPIFTDLWQQGQAWIPGILITSSSLVFVPHTFVVLKRAFPFGVCLSNTSIITSFSKFSQCLVDRISLTRTTSKDLILKDNWGGVGLGAILYLTKYLPPTVCSWPFSAISISSLIIILIDIYPSFTTMQ